MSATGQTIQQSPPVGVQTVPQKPPRGEWEWFWRFLAVVMTFTVGWVIWIVIQINPTPLVTRTAYEAAAKSRAARSAEGPIKAAPNPVPVAQASTESTAGARPLVDLERLKFSDRIETPFVERPDAAPAAR
ncbi:MAG TPA: hypothetical protein VIS77_07710 [Burkholderiales bacterium]